MATANRGHLHEEQLTDDAQKAAKACQDFLLQARYRPQGDYEVCDDDHLKEKPAHFMQSLHHLFKYFICNKA